MKKNFIILCAILIGFVAQAQKDSLGTCGITQAFTQSLGDSATIANATSRFGAATLSTATLTCGRFDLVFDDVNLGTEEGFDDATNGANLRQCVCDVANYIQSVFQIPTGDGSQIKILFDQSWTSTYTVGLPGPFVLAVGGGFRSSSSYTAGVAGFYGGNVYDHFTTGNDPDPNQIDGHIQVNFGRGYWICGQSPICTINYDFFGVILHEFTHTLGWASSLTDSPSIQSMYGTANQFSMYDKYFMHYGDINAGPLTKIVTVAPTPSVTAGLPSSALSSNQLWMESTLRNSNTLNQNVPVFSASGYFSGSGPPNTNSHISDYQDIFELNVLAPGFIADHIMGPVFGAAQTKNQYTPQELRYLTTMGYSYTSAFAAANAYLTSNRHPYTTKTTFDPTWCYTSVYYQAEVDMNTVVLADKSITNCQTATFSLTPAADATLNDADGDKLYVYPGSLYNIRGCGNGGNNHSGLSVTTTTNGDIITYTPRSNFIGRAQFGFYLYDGKEKGAFMVYTIDVSGCNACGTNLVINGNFEEGMEIKTLANPAPDNTASQYYMRDMKYQGCNTVTYPDGTIFSCNNTVVTNGASGCTSSYGVFGSWSFNPGTPVSTGAGNERYYRIFQCNNFFRLCSSPQTCTRYILEFDIYSTSSFTLPIGFTNSPAAQGTPVALTNSVSVNIAGSASWQHITVPINYCSSTTNCTYLVLSNSGFVTINVDNLNFYVDPTPPALSVSVSPSTTTICSGTSTVLTASLTNSMCSNTYTWSPGGANTSTVSVSPGSTTVYTLTASDGCRTGTATATVTVNATPTVSISAAPSFTICSGTTGTLTASGATTYSWSTGATTASISGTPTVTSTFSVTGTTSGCSSTASSTVTVKATPTVSIVSTPTTGIICSGQTATLTASGASTYSWNTGPTTASITVTPTVNTTYTVTGTNTVSCSSTKTVTITVATPTLSVSGTTSICIGSNTTLTASGSSSSYTWSPTTALSCTACASPTASPTTTTTYTITGTSSAGCSGTKTVTITVNPLPTITLTPSAPTICYPATGETVTATGASTYSWSPATALSCSVCANPVASPTATTSYTVTGTSSAGCVNTKTVSVTVTTNTCSGTTVTFTASPTFTSSPAFIASSFTVPALTSYTLAAAEVRIAPGVQITVAATGTLTINDSWLHACGSCTGSMWQGIFVDNNGVLVVNSASTNYSYIEDAVIAVKTASSASSTPVPVTKITNTIFNKNTKGIYFDTHPGTYTNSIAPYNCVFTCRTLNSHSVASATWTATKNDISAATPVNTSTANPTTTTLAGPRSAYGVYANARSSSTATLTIGNASQSNNIFDNLDYGIYVYKTNLKSLNNRFQNLTGNSHVGSTPYGVGIYGKNVDPVYSLQVGTIGTHIVSGEPNTFLSCCRGVWTNTYSTEWINNNTFDCETTASSFNSGLVAGECGVINDNFEGTAEQLLFANNTCKNYATGFYHTFGKINNTTSQSSYWRGNTISSYTTSAGPNNYCATGIFLITSDGSSAASVPTDAMFITTNTITNVVSNAISATAVGSTATSGYLTIKDNGDLSVKYNSGATSLQSPPTAAVYLSGCGYVKVWNNTNIHSTSTGTYSASNAQYIHGVYVSQSLNTRVTCNTVSNMGEDFVWEGDNSGSAWLENTMSGSRYGLVLRSTGIMGDQGSASNPIYAVFSGTTSIVSGQTLTHLSAPGTAPTSKLFCINTTTCSAATMPLPCSNANNGGTPYGAATLSVTTGNSPSVCVSEGGTGRMANNSHGTLGNRGQADSSLVEIKNGIENGGPLPVNDAETRWSVQYYVSSKDPSIVAATGYENAKSFAMANTAAANGDYATAQAINNSIIPSNTIENNWQQVNTIWLKKVSDTSYQYTPSDIATLENIAPQCPLTGGSIVYKARGIINGYYGGIIGYPNLCGNDSISADELRKTVTQKVVNKNQFSLYPNPNSGSMTLEYSMKENGILEITDISGKLVGKYNLPVNSSKIQIINDDLQNGIYLYRIMGDNNILKTGKIAVMK
ncbi:MAG: T9SS type A sorting domain-containing protein [Bacteroidia bacterium]